MLLPACSSFFYRLIRLVVGTLVASYLLNFSLSRVFLPFSFCFFLPFPFPFSSFPFFSFLLCDSACSVALFPILFALAVGYSVALLLYQFIRRQQRCQQQRFRSPAQAISLLNIIPDRYTPARFSFMLFPSHPVFFSLLLFLLSSRKRFRECVGHWCAAAFSR